MYFLLCPRQGLKIEDGVLHRVYILGLFCPKQGQGLKPSAAPLYPTIGQVPPPGGRTIRKHIGGWGCGGGGVGAEGRGRVARKKK